MREDSEQLVSDALRHLTAGIENEELAGVLFAVGLIAYDHVRRFLNWLPI